MKKRNFIIFDLMVQTLSIAVLIYWTVLGYEFLEYNSSFPYFILLGFWQLAAALIKQYHYEMNLKTYLTMVRNFGIASFSIFILAFILNQFDTPIFNIIFILLFIILIWSFLLAALYFYLTIRQVVFYKNTIEH